MKKTLCRVIAAILLITIICIAMLEIGKTVSAGENWACFYDCERDTIDVILIGSSGIELYYQQAQAYDERGFTSFVLSSAAQPYELITTVMDEAMRYQDPDVFVVEIRNIVAVEDSYEKAETEQEKLKKEYNFRQVLWGLMDSFSPCRWKSILKFKNGMSVENFLESCFPLLGYHENIYDWEKTTAGINTSWENFFGNARMTTITDYSAWEPAQRALTADGIHHLSDKAKKAVDEIAEKAEEYNKPLLLLLTPYLRNEVMFSAQCELVDYIKSRGYDILDCFEYMNEIGIDYSGDFYDSRHVNVIGAHKFTSWFAGYLDEHYVFEKNYPQNVLEGWDSLSEKWNTQYLRDKTMAEMKIYIEDPITGVLSEKKQRDGETGQ